MTAENFVFWLNGYFELGGENLSPQQVQIIKDHLALVFNKVTPDYYGGFYGKAQKDFKDFLESNHPSYGGVIPLAYDPPGVKFFSHSGENNNWAPPYNTNGPKLITC